MNNLLNKILPFLKQIGLQYHLEPLNENTFLPGLRLRKGELVIDADKLLYPGDVLHEAGHLACVPDQVRRGMSGDLEDIDVHRSGEMMAIAWSYAAAVFLQINPEIVFHEKGYKGGGKDILHNFENGYYIGLPMLQWSGMCYDQTTAEKMGLPCFPHMIRWVCEK